MGRPKQRGPRVLYVAGSARELPSEVQDWLGRTGTRAAASGDPYDALATLAGGSRPVAIIVGMDSVDFSEMELFDEIARLSARSRVYVTGGPHCDAKIEAACLRGASLFEVEALEADLQAIEPDTVSGGSVSLLAGSLPASRQDPPRRTTPPAEPSTQKSAPRDEAREDTPSVRLVTPSQTEDDSDLEVPVPWAPSSRRPTRTPPPRQQDEPAATDSEPEPDEPAPAEPQRPAIVTPAELAALLGKPLPPDPDRGKEQKS